MALPAMVSAEQPGTFGAYDLVEQLGQGGMAAVFRARLRARPGGFVRDVVLKAMLPNLVQSAPLVSMFEDEARLTAQLRHPNIVQVQDFGVASGIPYLIMEYLDGKNLSQIRNAMNRGKRKVPVAVAVAIARDLCRALGYAHRFTTGGGVRMQVIHRDVSPSNVMVQRDGTVKLLDFGVAKLSSAAGQAVTSSLKGKFAYMAPEQVNQEPIDRRCDVFAAGIVLHELLTGRRLFGTKSELETLRRVSLAEAAPPSLGNGEVPPDLDAIVMRALSREARERFDSGEEMAAALDGLGVAGGRREIAQFIAEAFPAGAARAAYAVEPEPDADTEISSDEHSLEGITSPERAVSAPHLVLLPNDEAIIDEALERSRSASGSGREIEIEADPSGAHWAGGPTSTYEPGADRPTAERPLPPSPTVAAPIDEVRPTRVYDFGRAAPSPGAEFDNGPTSVFDMPMRTPPPSAPPSPPPIRVASPAAETLMGEPSVVLDERPVAAAPLAEALPMAPLVVPASAPLVGAESIGSSPPVYAGETALRVFDDLAEPTRAPPPARRRFLPLLALGGLLGVVAVAGGLAARALMRGGDPADEVTLRVREEPRLELAAPRPAEPQLPVAATTAPGAAAAEDPVSLVGLDKGGRRAPARTEEPAPRPAEATRVDAAPAPPRARAEARSPRAPRPRGEASTAREASTTVDKPEGRPRSTVKEGRIVDPFEGAE